MWFASRESVDRFLRLSQFDTDNPFDLQRLRDLHREAIDYLVGVHRYRMPEEIVHIDEIHDLFLMASRDPSQVQKLANMVLKVMHILQHVNGHELIFDTSISEAQLFDRLSGRVLPVIDRMRTTGIEVLEFSAGKKTRTSMITKLLAKRSTLAAHIFDKARFALTLKRRRDLVPSLTYLLHHLFAVSYVLPEQTQNGIITLGDIAEGLKLDPRQVWEFWTEGGRAAADDGAAPTPRNEFSGPNYRCVNFVVDMPVRLDDVASHATPAIAFAQAEFQLVDQQTAEANERGENAHARYKKRQAARIRARLECGSPDFSSKKK
jgi:uncharacterized protein (TIGR04552 family)